MEDLSIRGISHIEDQAIMFYNEQVIDLLQMRTIGPWSKQRLPLILMMETMMTMTTMMMGQIDSPIGHLTEVDMVLLLIR